MARLVQNGGRLFLQGNHGNRYVGQRAKGIEESIFAPALAILKAGQSQLARADTKLTGRNAFGAATKHPKKVVAVYYE